jgi:NADH-quinone oxidoreductase subunit F
MEKDRTDSLFKKYIYKNTIPIEPEGGKRQYIEKLSSEKWENNFKEVSLGLSEKKAKIEAIRCLRCDVKETDYGK